MADTQPIETQMDDAPGALYVQRRAVDGKRFNWTAHTWDAVTPADEAQWQNLSKLFTQESPNYYVVVPADIPDEAVDRVATDLVFAKSGSVPATTDKCYGIFNSQAHEVAMIRRTVGASGIVHGQLTFPWPGCPVPSVQQDSVGLSLVIALVDEEGVPYDLSAATNLKIRIEKPDGTGQEFTALLNTDGTDGALAYVTAENDLDDVGTYKIQAMATVDDEKKISSISTFKVLANIGLPEA